MADDVEKDHATESEPVQSPPQIDGERESESIFNPLEWGPDEAYSKVYDCTGPRRIWLGDLPGVPTQEHLASCLEPGRYMLMIRAGEACPVEGKAKGVLIHPNYPIVIPGERTTQPTNVARAMIAGGVAASTHVRGADAVRSEAPPPPPASSSNVNSVPTALVDLIARLVTERPAREPIGGLGMTPELVDLMVKIKGLQTEPQQVTVTDIRGAFEEGLKLGDAKGYARASAEHGTGDGSGGPDILTVLEKVLGSPAIEQLIERASAPAVTLESLQTAATAGQTERASHDDQED